MPDEANPARVSAFGAVTDPVESAVHRQLRFFVDDTSAYADLILPDHSFLESWIDAQPSQAR